MHNRVNVNQLLQNSATIEDAVHAIQREIPGTKPKNLSSENALIELAQAILSQGDSITVDQFHKLVELDKQLVQVSPQTHQKLYTFCVQKFLGKDTTYQKHALSLLSKHTVFEAILYKFNQLINYYLGSYINKNKELAESSFSKQCTFLQYIELVLSNSDRPAIIEILRQLEKLPKETFESLIDVLRNHPAQAGDIYQMINAILNEPSMDQQKKVHIMQILALMEPSVWSDLGSYALFNQLQFMDDQLLMDTIQALEVIPRGMRTTKNLQSAIEKLRTVLPKNRSFLIEQFKINPSAYFDE